MALSFTPDPTFHDVAPDPGDVGPYKRYALIKYWYQEQDLEPMHTLLSFLSKDDPEEIMGVLEYYNGMHAYPLVIAAVPYLEHVKKVDSLETLVDILMTLLRDAPLDRIHTVLQWCPKWKCNFNKAGVNYHSRVTIALMQRPFTSEKDKLELLQAFIAAGFSPGFFFNEALGDPRSIRFAETILVNHHDKIPKEVRNEVLRQLLVRQMWGDFESIILLLLVYGATLDPAVTLTPEQKTRYTAALDQAKKQHTGALSFTPDPNIRDDVTPLGGVQARQIYALNKFIHHRGDRQPIQTLLNNIDPDRILDVLYFFRDQYAYLLLIDAACFLSRGKKLEVNIQKVEVLFEILLWRAPLDRMDEILKYPYVRALWKYWKEHVSYTSLVHTIMNRRFTSEKDKLNLLKTFVESGLSPGRLLYENIKERIFEPHVMEFILVHFHDDIEQEEKNKLLVWILHQARYDMDAVVLPLLLLYGARYQSRYPITEDQRARYNTAHAQVVAQYHGALQSIPLGPPADQVLNDPHLRNYIDELLLYPAQ